MADLAREGAERLVGPAELLVGRDQPARGQVELEHVDDPVGQDPQLGLHLRVDRAGLLVVDAERADDDVVGRAQGVGGVEPDVAHLAVDVGVVAEAGVLAGVGQEDRALVIDHQMAHRRLTRHAAGPEADGRDLDLLLVGDQVDRGLGDAGHARGQVDQGEQGGPGFAVEDAVAVEGRHPSFVVGQGGHSPGAFHTASHLFRSFSIGSSSASASRIPISTRLSRCCGPVGAKA